MKWSRCVVLSVCLLGAVLGLAYLGLAPRRPAALTLRATLGEQQGLTALSLLAFSPDGRMLAAGMKNSGGTAVRLWDVGTRNRKSSRTVR